MAKLPEYIGPHAFGVKMGVIVPGTDIVQAIFKQLARCYRDGLLEDGDIVCITESVVARAQNNYVTTADVAAEIREKLQLAPGSRLGLVFPIATRNRLALVCGHCRWFVGDNLDWFVARFYHHQSRCAFVCGDAGRSVGLEWGCLDSDNRFVYGRNHRHSKQGGVGYCQCLFAVAVGLDFVCGGGGRCRCCPGRAPAKFTAAKPGGYPDFGIGFADCRVDFVDRRGGLLR